MSHQKKPRRVNGYSENFVVHNVQARPKIESALTIGEKRLALVITLMVTFF